MEKVCEGLATREPSNQAKAKWPQIKVYYDGPLNRKLDEALENCLKDFGFSRWASGFNLTTERRDLAFEKVDKKSDGKSV